LLDDDERDHGEAVEQEVESDAGKVSVCLRGSERVRGGEEAMSDPKKQFWNTFLTSLETVPREAQDVRGVSGFVHPILAVGVDEARRRTVIVSGDPDARTAALAQADIQAALPHVKIVMARPVAINLQPIALVLMEKLGGARIPFSRFELLSSKEKGEQYAKELLNDVGEIVARPYLYVQLNTLSLWKEVIQQLSLLQFEGFSGKQEDQAPDLKAMPMMILERLLRYDPVAVDRSGGVCAVPLHLLDQADFEAIARGDVDYARTCFVRHGVFQYFFPPADQIALAAVDRNEATTPDAISRRVQMAPVVGHPLAPNELVDPQAGIMDLMDALKDRDLLVDGSMSIEVSPSGHVVRSEVKFRPREGVMEKLARVLSIKVDINLKDLFK
jgi:hypothetical protein